MGSPGLVESSHVPISGPIMKNLPLCAVALVVLWSSPAAAWDRYSVAGDSTNCAQCHGDFGASPYTSMIDGMSWGNDLHDVHRATMLGGDCNACHTSGGRVPVRLASSNGGSGLAAISCMGCHGRAEDDTSANPATPAMGGYGAGLRQHHAANGVTMCVTCHADANPAAYTPVGEDVLPPYYASPGSGHPAMPVDPCNPLGSEDFAAGPLGLDNDGDDLFDGADPDCMMIPDGGMGTDAGMVGTDAGMMGTDAGMTGTDAGMMDADGGPTSPDAGPTSPDAGMMAVDGGVMSADAAVPGADAGTPPVDEGGCGCSVPSRGGEKGGAVALVLGALLLVRRRRR